MLFIFASIFTSYLIPVASAFLSVLMREHKSGVSKQLLMAGVKFKHNYVADWAIEFYYLVIYSGVLLLFMNYVIR